MRTALALSFSLLALACSAAQHDGPSPPTPAMRPSTPMPAPAPAPAPAPDPAPPATGTMPPAVSEPPAPAPDAGVAPVVMPPVAPVAQRFACTAVLGVSVTHDWFTGGFEKGVDDARWETLAPAQALISFVQNWADPKNSLWTKPKTSPCAMNADDPDRVIFTPVNWDYTSAAQWVPQLEAALTTIQMKFPHLREIDLMTMLRAPGNKSCGSTESVVQPFLDEAVATVAGRHPDLVKVIPPFFAPSCAVFTGGGPHFTPDGRAVIAKLYSDYFGAMEAK